MVLGDTEQLLPYPKSQPWLRLVRLLPSHTSVGYFKRERDRFVVMLPLGFWDFVCLFFKII